MLLYVYKSLNVLKDYDFCILHLDQQWKDKTCQKCVWNHTWNIWIFILFSLMIDYHSLQKITTVESPVTEVCDEYSQLLNIHGLIWVFFFFFRMKWLAITSYRSLWWIFIILMWHILIGITLWILRSIWFLFLRVDCFSLLF